jgi:phage host-nuclease inhibitor protein Gam
VSESVRKLQEQQLNLTNDHTMTEWMIDSMEVASWAGRKIAHARNEIASIDAWEKKEIESIKAAAETERKRHENEIAFFEGHLGAYLHHLIQEGRKTKTLNLPTGTVSIRARQPKLIIRSDETALAWAASNHPDAVRVKQSLDMTAFKRRLEFVEGGRVIDAATGELLQFVIAEPQADTVNFKPAEEEE